ncbi:ras-related protein Rab-32B-like [Acanthaster planci]|uniref:Ras-related protein Rab n=1 Tax=Acanthaster planci TaxID=133434 RepID=A0A8B7YQS2_ACAPL|nr:ras-related protein Rab-32B-like [Acanthaster planci]XP_022095624.1 ras-related protein Rab-32B-like [Acanthaster planci]XP_022095625.1 ras-related protein Rab-32B-like [Acanthaster planci]XP_022095626.1 ras-related protein Rab-32B-like [Acanthaster planci]
MSSSEKQVTEHLYKVLVIGEFGVGKTSIIRRYTEDRFSPNYKLTIGVDFALKPIDWDNTKRINLQLWDIAGHERFGHMTRVYYKYAIAAVIVFDLSRPATFDSVLKWYSDVNQKVMLANEQPVPVLLLANKCDLEDTVLDAKMLEDFCHKHNFIGWFATSAKDNINIEEAMRFLVQNILELTADAAKPNEHISLHQDKDYFEPIDEEEDNLSLAEEKSQRRCCSR